jgi:hypothetical protein
MAVSATAGAIESGSSQQLAIAPRYSSGASAALRI